MQKPALDVTQSHKITRSAVGPQSGRAFGEQIIQVPALDTLALAGAAYNQRIAYLLSVIAAWSYADERVLADKLRYYGLPGARIRRISVQNDALLVASTAYLIQSQSGKVAVLAFRGTDPANLINVLTDTQVMLQPFYGTHVHAGFFTAVDVLWDDVHQALVAARAGKHLADDDSAVDLGNPLEALYVTGHSLGGAMAVLAAARLTRPDYRVELPNSLIKGVYTYGQPMVGDAPFADYCQQAFGERLFRHVYHNDVVPRVPPRSSLDYAHTGPELRAAGLTAAWASTRKQSERVSLAVAAVSVGLQAIEVRSSSRDLLPGPSIDDHSPANYMAVSRYTLDPATAVITPEAPLLTKAAEFLFDTIEEAENTVSHVFERTRAGAGV